MLKPPLASSAHAFDLYRAALFMAQAPGFRNGLTMWTAQTLRAFTIVCSELRDEATFLEGLERMPQSLSVTVWPRKRRADAQIVEGPRKVRVVEASR